MCSRWVGWLGLVLLAGCCRPMTVQNLTRLTTDPSPVPDSGPVIPWCVEGCCDQKGKHPVARVALIEIDGPMFNNDMTGPYSMGENPVSLFRERLDAAAKDPALSAVVLRINSPGGGVNACDLLHRELVTFKARTHKPVVAMLLGHAAGGAYFLASAADVLVADPTCLTGGVGIIINLVNLKELMQQFNIFPQQIKAGQNIDLGSLNRKLTEEEQKLLQTIADEYHRYLIAGILQHRPQITQDNGTTFDGRIFSSTQALERGLIDRIGFLDEALALARQLGGCPQGGVVMYHRCNDPARSVYAQTPLVPMQAAGILPSLPGVDRARLPLFLAMWEPDMTLERMSGK